MELMESASVNEALLKLGLPTMVGMVVSSLYNLVDAFFVGRLGTLPMAAVSVVFPVSMVGTGLALLFATGGSVYISRMLGKREYDEVVKCNSTVIVSGLLTVSVVIAIAFLFFDRIMNGIGATPETLPYVRQYGYLFILGLFFNVFNAIANNIINSEGAVTYSMAVMFIGGGCNVILDPIFIFAMHLGVMGAAIATLISRIVSTSLYLFYYAKKTTYLKFSFKKVTFDRKLFAEIFKVGVPTMFFQLLNFISLGLVNVVARRFGNAAIAAIGIVNRIFMVEVMMMVGFVKGFQPFVAFNAGRQDYGRVQSARKTSIRWLTLCSLAVAVLAIAFSKQLILMFNKTSAEVLSIGVKALWVVALSGILQGYQLVNATCLLAIGKAKQGGFLSVCRQVYFIPLIFLMSHYFGINGLISCQLVADILSVATTFIVVKNVKLPVGVARG